MDTVPRMLIVLGLLLVAIGVLWQWLPLGRLPGDLRIERDGLRVYIPITTSIVLSAVLSALLWLASRGR